MGKHSVALVLIAAFCGVTFGGSLDDLSGATAKYKETRAALSAAYRQEDAKVIASAQAADAAARTVVGTAIVAAAKDATVSNDALDQAAIAVDRLEGPTIGWALSAAVGWRWASLKDATIAKKHKDAALAELGASMKRIWTTGILYSCWYAGALSDAETLVFLRSCAVQGKVHILYEILPLLPRTQMAGVATAAIQEMDATGAKTFLAFAQKNRPTILDYILKLNAAGQVTDADALKFLEAATAVVGSDVKMEESTVAVLKDLKTRRELLEKAAKTQEP